MKIPIITELDGTQSIIINVFETKQFQHIVTQQKKTANNLDRFVVESMNRVVAIENDFAVFKEKRIAEIKRQSKIFMIPELLLLSIIVSSLILYIFS